MSPTPHYSLVPKDLDANLKFRKALLQEAANDPLAASQIRQMCSEDLLFYCGAFCMTYDPRSKVKVTPFIPYEFQEEAMLALVDCVDYGRDAVMFKSRDMGASWIGLTVIEWLWHFRYNLSFLLVSRNEDYVDKRGNPKSLFWKIDFLHLHQPRWLLPHGRWLGQKDPNRKLLHLKNESTQSVIDGESTTGDAGRGDRRTAMFIDEHAAFEVNDGFKILRSTRDTTNCRIFNSTPQGANNAFHEVVEKTNAKKLRLHWSAHPEKNRGLYTTDVKTGKVRLIDEFINPITKRVTRIEQIEGMVSVSRKEGDTKSVFFPRDYPFELDRDNPGLRSPWYDEQCARCVSPQEIAQELDIDFAGSAFPFFDPKFINTLKRRYASKPLLVGELEYDRETFAPRRFFEERKGRFELWTTLAGEFPAQDRHFVMGCDVSAGTGASNSAVSVADRETGEKVARWISPHMRPHEFAGLAMAIGKFFNNAYLVWDASGPTGETFTKRVLEESYGNIYCRRYEKKVTREISDKPGYFLNAVARQVLLEDYRAALADHRFINHSEQGLEECLQFIRRPGEGIEHSASANAQDPSGARTAHGDEVIADALCCLGVYERQTVAKAEEPEEPVGSLAWRRTRNKKMSEARRIVDRLGEGW